METKFYKAKSFKQIALQSITLLAVTTLLGVNVYAKNQTNNQKNKSLPNTKLSTDIHFDDLNVHGRRQSPFGATATVESEKNTPKLIDYRTDFKDRLAQQRSGR